ncbi:MAG: hypothetical protein AVDCRST_MAG86-3483 [uncultured Truepera sp.]|uniref:Methyltransferase domain-containing protein n=1 Tax=uncultured Truepera sp. TaxID=543023 RepID=A0A6J4VR77_9DEIN|nr:MAG: hypothetical protein AVDCRST_MAG86-3483 [uncultured Truepera sp.]
MTTFTDEPLARIIEVLRGRLGTLEAGERLTFRALDPDLGVGLFAGEFTEINGVRYRHRPLRSWLDLAERLGCRLHTPESNPESGRVLINLSFSKLGEGSWHSGPAGGKTASDPAASETYGQASEFARVQKLEEPTFWLDYTEALERTNLEPNSRVLSLGVGRGDELEPFERVFRDYNLNFTGVDHSASALAAARERFPGANCRFLEADMRDLQGLELGRFDLILSVATFQSPGVAGHTLIRELVQHFLTAGGSLIVALPNCRYQDGEVRFGARMKNFAQPDLSLVVKDLAFYRKYLYQHRFKVFLTGKYYLFLTAVR